MLPLPSHFPLSKCDGYDILYLNECSSTNDYARKLVNSNYFNDIRASYKYFSNMELKTIKKHSIPNFTSSRYKFIIHTDKQTNGIGQRGSRWHADSFKNLHFSIIVKPPNLLAKFGYKLNIISSVASFLALKRICNENYDSLNSELLKIKWPNDILYDNKKIGGILIENILKKEKIDFSIIGIGININQKLFEFDPNMNYTSSLAIESCFDFKIHDIATIFFDEFNSVYNQFFFLNKQDQIKEDYLNNLHRNDNKFYKFKDKIVFYGLIKGIDDIGRLVIQNDKNIIKRYFPKEIISIR